MITMKASLLLAALIASGCSSSTAPTPEAPQAPKVVIDCSLVGTLPCQQPPPVTPTAPKPTPPVTTATVHGTVTDGTSGGILPNILIVTQYGQALKTDAAGQYQLTGIAIGPLFLTVSAESYITQRVTANIAADTIVDVVLQRVAPYIPAPPPAPRPIPTPTPTPAPVPLLFITMTCSTLAAPLNTSVNCNMTALLDNAVVTSQIASVSWEWADGSTTTTAAPATSHNYTHLGTYLLAARVAMTTGGSGSGFASVIIK